jgi:hypothetical protein
MKTKKVTAMACLFVFGFGTVANAQQPRTCATMANQERLEKMYPEMKAAQAAIEEQTQNHLLVNARESAATVNIPVVVHVLYNTTAQNISDAQIISQIDVLNEDFRKMNADKVNVPSAFAGVAADCNISFCLAKKDPNGNTTTGIVRKFTSSTSFIDDDKVKSSATGGDNAWNSAKYLNLWVCNLGNGLLGYAQFPGGPASTDGVVILYTAFGRTGNVASPYNKGRTATHEVGHWLNLRHIWGDANCGSDLVSDTPTQQTSNYGCPTYPHVTCSNSGDMSMNYMDYVNDACMYMFTAGQSSRMNALFASTGARVGLLTSTGCGTTTSTGTTTPSSTSNVVTIGSGASSTGVVPYGTYYMDERAQIIVTKAELVAAGFTSTNKYIKSLAFNALTAQAQTMNGFTIKIAHTTASSFASTSFLTGSSPVTVYSSNFVATSNSWNTHTFSTPFLYNGVDNLLIDICWNNAAYTNNTPVYATTTTNYMTLYKRSDVTSGGLCTTTAGTQTTYRPNMKMNFSSSSTVGSSSSSTARLSDDGITTPKDVVTNVYPNPVSDKMTLSYSVFEENADVTMEMYDLYGRKVMATDLGSAIGENNIEIDFTNDSRLQYLQNGIYFVSLTVNGEKTVKKIMLQK